MQKLIDDIEEMNKMIAEVYYEKKIKRRIPHIAIISTSSDEASKRYIRNKRKKCEEFHIITSLHEPQNMDELYNTISNLNKNSDVTSIIIQYPFGNWVTLETQKVFDLVIPQKDIDRLHSCWFYDKRKHNLPLTASGIYELIESLRANGKIKENSKILFHGNGITTNKRLFLKMFDEGVYDCRIINSKTPKQSVKELIHWADVIISGTGKKDSLDCTGKIVICPSIINNQDGTFSNDLKDDKKDKNYTHKVLGAIGKLTVSNLLVRAYRDVLEDR